MKMRMNHSEPGAQPWYRYVVLVTLASRPIANKVEKAVDTGIIWRSLRCIFNTWINIKLSSASVGYFTQFVHGA